MKQNKFIIFPRQVLCSAFVDRMYKQRNMKAISKGDHVIIPGDMFGEFAHDIGVILGKAIEDTVEHMTIVEELEDEDLD